MNKLKNIIITLLLIAFTVSAAAQDGFRVTGTVRDENGEPLAGVGIIEKGTTNGTVTDFDGKYSIVVSNPNSSLTFNYISYDEESVNLKGKAVVNLRMTPVSTPLDEAVVIGYNTVRRSDLTGSVSSVAGKALEGFKTSSVLEALGGQISGVLITSEDGTPGSGFDVKIRGVGSLNGDSSPVYIVDGFEVDDLSFVANQDILSIDVLKDASAAAIYGSRAANGVVLVTTKSGQEGRMRVAYNGSASYRVISKQLDVLSPYEFVKLQMEINETRYAGAYYSDQLDSDGNPYRFQTLDDYIGYDGINWQKEAFSPTWSQSHDVSISGGSKDTKYLVTFSHFDEDGIFSNSGYEKNTVRAKFNQNLTRWLTMDLSVSYASTLKTGIGTSESSGSMSVLSSLLRARPTAGIQMSDEDFLKTPYDPLEEEYSNAPSANPIQQSLSVTNKTKSEQWIANGALTFKFTNWLTFKSAGVYNSTHSRRDLFYGESSTQAYRNGGAYGEARTTKTYRWTNTNTLTYKQKIKKHNITAMLGHEVSYYNTSYLRGQSQDFPLDDLGSDYLTMGATPTLVESSMSDNTRLSFFAQGIYNWANRYHFTATFRADASSVFSANHKWGYFPSFAAAWTISEEPFMKGAKNWLSNLKLRVGWGMVGNDRISNYLSLDLYSVSKYGVGSSLTTVLLPEQLANYDLKWEASTTTNIGLDMGFLDHRLNLTIDLFNKDTKDLLLAQDLSYVSGFSSQWQNSGKIRNQGLEITLNTVNIKKRNFHWGTDFNISFIKNTLVSLPNDTEYMLSHSDFQSLFSEYDYISRVGSTIGNMYGYIFDGVYQYSDFNTSPSGGYVLKDGVADISPLAGTTVVPGMVKYKDINGDGVITTDDRTIIGNGYPKWYGGMTNTFTFYGVDISFMFQFSYGNDVYNATRMFSTQTQDERANQLAETADRWTTTNASNTVPSATGYIKYSIYSRFIEDGSFLRLKNATVGYTFPEKWTNKFYVTKLRIYFTGQNLFTITKYSGYDPEVNMRSSPLMPGFDWGAYPKSRVYTMGIELNF